MSYEKIMLDAIKQFEGVPGIHHVVVEHDHHCSVFKVGKCNCNPVKRKDQSNAERN